MEKTVQNGIKYLLKKGYSVKQLKEAVNHKDFNMANPCGCICGRLEGSYVNFSYVNFLGLHDSNPYELGFILNAHRYLITSEVSEAYKKLTQIWKYEVNKLEDENEI